MKKNIIISISVIFSLIGCKIDDYYHKPGGPYYFKSGITYQGIQPKGEITQEETKEFENNGNSVYISYFNDDGKPILVEKHYDGKIITKYELIYENKKLIETIITDEKGNKKIQRN